LGEAFLKKKRLKPDGWTQSCSRRAAFTARITAGLLSLVAIFPADKGLAKLRASGHDGAALPSLKVCHAVSSYPGRHLP
jgi:hypothetical protein